MTTDSERHDDGGRPGLERAWLDRDLDPIGSGRLLAAVEPPPGRGPDPAALIVAASHEQRAGRRTAALGRARQAESLLAETPTNRWHPRLNLVLAKVAADAGLAATAYGHLATGLERSVGLADDDCRFELEHDAGLVLDGLGDRPGAMARFDRAQRWVGPSAERSLVLATGRARGLTDEGRLDAAAEELVPFDLLGPEPPATTGALYGLALSGLISARRGQLQAGAAALERGLAIGAAIDRPCPDLVVLEARLAAAGGHAGTAVDLLTELDRRCRSEGILPPIDAGRLWIELAVEAGDYRDAYHRVEAIRLEERDRRRRNLAIVNDLRLDERSAELRARAAELAEANRELDRSLGELRQLHDHVLELSARDSLTGLFNRRQLFIEAGLLLRLARRHRRPLSIAMVDIDHFKRVNDAHLHATGDLVLQELADILTDRVRESDLIGRYGGDEFVILLPEVPLAGARVLCDRIRQAVEDHPWPEIKPSLQITVTIGVAQSGADESAEALLHRADQRLYEAKAQGRNRVGG